MSARLSASDCERPEATSASSASCARSSSRTEIARSGDSNTVSGSVIQKALQRVCHDAATTSRQLRASSTKWQSAFASRISSTVLQSASRSRGAHTSSTRHCAREDATLIRFGLNTNESPRGCIRSWPWTGGVPAHVARELAGDGVRLGEAGERRSSGSRFPSASGWCGRSIRDRATPCSSWAAGPGGTGFAAAPILGEQGRLISSDFSSEMVEVARRRSTELGLANVEHRVIDAEEMSLEDDSVDGVLCRFGFMLMPDPAAALAETRRVLRPEGRLALAVWGTAAENPWVAIAGLILAERGLSPPPEPGAPGMFVLADEARLSQLLQGAGFDVERVERVPVRFEFDDVDDYIVRTKDLGGAVLPGSGATPPTRTATPSGRVSPRTTSRSRSTGATRFRGRGRRSCELTESSLEEPALCWRRCCRRFPAARPPRLFLAVCAVTGSGNSCRSLRADSERQPGPFQQGGVNAPPPGEDRDGARPARSGSRAELCSGRSRAGHLLAGRTRTAIARTGAAVFAPTAPDDFASKALPDLLTAGRRTSTLPSSTAHTKSSSAATSCAEARRPDTSSSS